MEDAYAAAHEKMNELDYRKTDLADCAEISPFTIDLDDVVSKLIPGGDLVKLETAIVKYQSIWL